MPRILGTAGHIDHGKTALVKALTGVDTDRLQEERERGISIDLGFAPFDTGAGLAGVVDVPGHERFIRNMLAGAHGVDVALLVVAADDGVMPQTEEHLDILHLLGVCRGVVAMTKVDLADAARRRGVREEIEILLDGTGLEGAPIVEVSVVSGEGLPTLRAALIAALRDAEPAPPQGGFRLPVDRAFVVHGHGVVVTGTATAGSVRSGATLRVLPGGAEVRVRGVQVHGQPAAQAGAGQRVALNLAGIAHEALHRGQVLCDAELDRVTDRFDAWVELRPAARRPLAQHAEVRVHLGTAEVLGRIVWLDGRAALPPKSAALAQLTLRAPLAAFGGDRFILRDATARATIGGGRVLQPFAARPARRPDPRLPQLEALRDARSPLERLRALLNLDPAFAVAPAGLAAAANLRAAEVRVLLATQRDLQPLPDAAHAEAYTTAEKWQRLRDAALAALAAFHRAAPQARGLEMESLRSQLAGKRLGAALPPKVFRAVVEQLAGQRALVREDSLLRLPTHQGGLSAAETEQGERLAARLVAAAWTPPDVTQIAAELAIPPARLAAILAELEGAGRIARADAGLYFSRQAVTQAEALLHAHAAAHGDISAAQFRDLIGASRKFSLGLLTYFDRIGVTRRIGDVRKVRKERS